jgi:3-hydroxybutyryl-CoA dehydrogenase
VRVAVIGAGLMGAQIGCEYALGGHEVVLQARDVGAVRARVDAAFALLSAHGLRTQAELAQAARRVSTVDRPADAAGGAEIVVESLPEDLELKVSILQPACAAAPGAIVATNTSSLSISAIGEAIGRPEQTVGTHYLNPPLLMPPVEVVAGERTSSETVELVRTVLAGLGKLPIVVRRDVSGFVWNRLQFALVRECVWLVENGVATTEDVDTVMREGLARRWRRVGPLRSIALGGADTWNRAGRNIVPELSNASQLPDLSKVAITSGDLAATEAARDAGLAGDLRDDTKTGGRS